MSATVVRAFVASSPGIEPMLDAELAAMGARTSVERGGVEFSGPLELLWRVHRDCRLGESVRVRLKAFDATTFGELEAQLARLPWHAYLRPSDVRDLRIDVTARRSRLYHSDAVAERVLRVVVARLGASPVSPAQPATAQGPDPSSAGSEPSDAPRLFVRIVNDRVQVSVDASGDLLHRRGYRTHVVRAPVRETLAAALALLLERCLTSQSGGASDRAGTGERPPVWDPFCGSGTLLIEWLARATGVAPGRDRSFAFERWPTHDAAAYARWRAEEGRTDPMTARTALQAFGSDLSQAAIDAATSNAERAGFADVCRLWTADFRQAAEQVPRGACILTNPPWGVRVGRGTAVSLYASFDALLAGRDDLRPVVLLCADASHAQRSRLKWRRELSFKSGGLAVHALSLNR